MIWTKPKDFAYEDDHKEKFVLKVISRKGSHSKQVLAERNVMMALTKSPWHTELIKTFKAATNLYIMLEYVPNGSLDHSLSSGRGLKGGTPPLILFYAGCVLSAMRHMHQVLQTLSLILHPLCFIILLTLYIHVLLTFTFTPNIYKY